MNDRTRGAAPSRWLAIFALVLAHVAAMTAYTGNPAVRTGAAAATVPPQDVTRIESRLSQLEQRFYSVEASIRGLEQQSRLSGISTGRPASDPEVNLLRAEVEALRLRLAEVECGLAKVDERTLSPAAKDARRRSTAGAAGDPCRINTDSPLRLPSRP
jgi:hypothetical protein